MNQIANRASTGLVCLLAGVLGVRAVQAGPSATESKVGEEMASVRAMIAELSEKLASVEDAIADLDTEIFVQRAYITRILRGGDKGSPHEFRQVVRQAQARLQQLMDARDGLVAEAKEIQAQLDQLHARLARLADSAGVPVPAVDQ